MQTRRPFEPEDSLRLQTPSDAQISPDGTRVAYTRTWADTEKDDLRAAIWMVPVAGGEPRRFTHGPKRDSTPRWSADGSQVAFLSERGEEGDPAQMYVMPADGGDARQLTMLPEGAGAPVWSPDGSRIAFVARVGAERESSDRAERERASKRPYEVDELKYKFDALGHFRGKRPQIFVQALEGGEAVQLTSGPYENTQPAWSPDGSQIAFISARHEERDFDAIADVLVIPSGGGESRQLTRSRGPCLAPSWSPDGRQIAYAGNAHPEGMFGGRHYALWSIDAEGGEPRQISQGFERSVGSPGPNGMGMPLVWTEGGTAILFAANDRGSQYIYCVSADGGTPRKLIGASDRNVVSASASADGARLACIVAGFEAPGQVVVVNADGGDERRLTNLNAELLAGLELSKPERLTFRGADGGEFEGWLLRPLGYREGRRYPLLLDIHGGPHGAWGPGYSYASPWRQTLAGRGWATLYINPRGSGGYEEDFATYIRAGWGERDFPDLMAAVDALIERGIADPDRLAVTGVSYGGYMTNWIVGHTNRFKAAISGACVSDLISFYGTADVGSPFFDYQFEGIWWEQRERYERLSPISYVDRITTPLLLLHSEGDLRCPIGQSEEMFVALRRQRKPVQLVRFAGGFHGAYLSAPPSHRVEHDRRLIDWLVRWVPAAEAERQLATAPADA